MLQYFTFPMIEKKRQTDKLWVESSFVYTKKEQMLHPPYKEGFARFTTVPFKLLSYKKCGRYRRFLVN